jgi:hypothetical protein
MPPARRIFAPQLDVGGSVRDVSASPSQQRPSPTRGRVHRDLRARAPHRVAGGGGLVTFAYAVVAFVHDATSMALVLAVDRIGWSAATTALLAGLAGARTDGRSRASSIGWYRGFIGLGNAAVAFGGVIADAVGLRTTIRGMLSDRGRRGRAAHVLE